MPNTTTIYVCTTCDKNPDLTDTADAKSGLEMQASVKRLVKSMPEEEQAKFKIRGVKCMGGCLNACSVAVTAPKKQACLFVNLSPEDTEDVRTIITTHQQSRIGKPKLPEHLKPKFLCRIPQPVQE